MASNAPGSLLRLDCRLPNAVSQLRQAKDSTLLLEDVAALPYKDQCLLLDWLQYARGNCRLIATVSDRAALVSSVSTGSFSNHLHYRIALTLNI